MPRLRSGKQIHFSPPPPPIVPVLSPTDNSNSEGDDTEVGVIPHEEDLQEQTRDDPLASGGMARSDKDTDESDKSDEEVVHKAQDHNSGDEPDKTKKAHRTVKQKYVSPPNKHDVHPFRSPLITGRKQRARNHTKYVPHRSWNPDTTTSPPGSTSTTVATPIIKPAVIPITTPLPAHKSKKGEKALHRVVGCLPQFSGNSGEDVVMWTRQWEANIAADLYDPHELLLAIATKLTGKASYWYYERQKDAQSCFTSAAQVVSALKEKYFNEDVKAVNRAELATLIKQGQGSGSVETYYDSFVTITRLAEPMTQRQEVDMFVQGLRPDIQRELLVQRSMQASSVTLEQAYQAARRMELIPVLTTNQSINAIDQQQPQARVALPPQQAVFMDRMAATQEGLHAKLEALEANFREYKQ